MTAADDEATVGLAIGCFGACILMIISWILVIYECFRPDIKIIPEPTLTPPKHTIIPMPISVYPQNPTSTFRTSRFTSTIPGRTDAELEKSEFLYYYRGTDQTPSKDQVIDSLIRIPNINDRGHKICRSIESTNPDHDILKTYTTELQLGNKKFYEYVNEQLCKDNGITLRILMPLIRRGTWQINNHEPQCSRVVYRGMMLENHQRNYFTDGKTFRFPGFTSTSQNEAIARQFGNTVFEIYIPENCRHVRNVGDISEYQYEEEWLFSPYSRFRVQAVYNGRIILESLDNLI